MGRPLYQMILGTTDHVETHEQRMERLARQARQRGEVPADPFEGVTGPWAVGADPSYSRPQASEGH
jgi:ribosomal protein L25 (general stress protein Ctc)